MIYGEQEREKGKMKTNRIGNKLISWLNVVGRRVVAENRSRKEREVLGF